MVAHPGEGKKEIQTTKNLIRKHLDFSPEQVQIFTPTPSTWSTCAYFTEIDEEEKRVTVEKNIHQKELFKKQIIGK